MSFLQRAKEMLGLGDDYYDDEYEDDDYYDDDGDDAPESETSSSRSVYRSPYGESTAVKRLDREPDVERARGAAAPVVQMHIVEPRSYSEVQSIADKFKTGTPVIMNLSVSDPDLSKRLIDFASGLTYGLDGGLQKVSDRVLMLTPANVDVSEAQRRDLRERGLFTFGE